MKKAILVLVSILLNGCLGMPHNIKPVNNFKIDNYLGKWYEIARLDHSFEKGLSHVFATYKKRSDGGIDVLNQGFSKDTNKWKKAIGRAYFQSDKTKGYLKVAFFRPFYGSYIVFGLDHKNYQYAFVCGSSTNYLWLLARTPSVSPNIKSKFIEQAQTLGFNTNEIIWIEQK